MNRFLLSRFDVDFGLFLRFFLARVASLAPFVIDVGAGAGIGALVNCVNVYGVVAAVADRRR